MLYAHYIVTRFNLKLWGKGPNQNWMEHRFKLFDRFTFPSVKAQLNQDFKWLVFFDAGTDKSWIEPYLEYENFIPVFVETSLDRRRAFEEHLDGIPEFLIMTRLDNDDAIREDFIARVQGEFRRQETEFINLARGYVWNDVRQDLYAAQVSASPFISMIQKYKGWRSIYGVQHKQACTWGHVKEIAEDPAWLIVVHGRNRLNRVFGQEVFDADLSAYNVRI